MLAMIVAVAATITAVLFGPATGAATPPFGNVLSLDGVSQYASVPDSDSLDVGTTGDFTAETSFYVPDQSRTATDTLFWHQGSWGLYLLNDVSGDTDRFIFRLCLLPGCGVGSYLYIYYEVALSVGWHHVAAEFDNGAIPTDVAYIYLDGAQVKSGGGADWNPGLPNSSSDFYVGGYAGVNPAAGYFDETRLSDTLRYAGATYTVPTAPFSPDASTRALWHFNDSPCGATFADASTHGNTLTGQNGAHTTLPGAPAPEFQFSASGYAAQENVGSATLTVTRAGDVEPAGSVGFATSNGTATAGSDYTATSGTLNFACGQTSKTVAVPITNDTAAEPAETINLTLSAPTTGFSLGAPTITTLTIKTSDQRPDGLISAASSSGYIGNNVYNTTGYNQTKTSSARRGQTKTFYVRVCNDGNVQNSFTIKGSAATSGSTVRYYSGLTNITTGMRSTAGYKVSLAPGAYKQVKVQISVTSSAAPGSTKSATVSGTWKGDGTRSDVVKAKVKVVS
jgi:hypothetical protein